MKSLDEILDFEGRTIEEIITDLKVEKDSVPDWDVLINQYEPKFHKIARDTTNRKDKVRSDKSVEEAARLCIGLEKLLVDRVTEFTFGIPVKRRYSNIEGSEVRQQIATAIEKIYKNAHINKQNIERGLAYYASCQICTVWYAVKKPNNLYGFNSEYKLKCKTYSPMDGVKLYPLFDEYDDMIAMSFGYSKSIAENDVEFFETYTSDRRYKWRRDENGWVEELYEKDAEGNDISGNGIILMKIPCIYISRTKAVYTEDTSDLRNDLEYTLSRDSDTVAYNSSPVLKVVGSVEGEEQKGESKRVYRVENGGDVAYVSWDQSTAANQNHIDNLMKFYWMMSQMPDLSFENMKGLGNIGFDARQTLLSDAHLKIKKESGGWLEFFERENNVVKAFLKQMNKKWEDDIDEVEIENIITPYIPKDEAGDIKNRMAANGGKPIESHLESIARYGKSSDPQATLDQINKEAEEESNRKVESMNNLFNNSNQAL